MNDITTDAQRLLTVLYHEYLNRRRAGQSMSTAARFSDSNFIQATLFPHESAEDIANLCWELQRNGYVTCLEGDDIADSVELRSETIVTMEQRFPRGLKEVIDAIGSLSGLFSL